MKVSEAINKLEVGETVWVKATVDRINNEGKYIRVMPNASFVYLDGNDEISLCDPQPEKVEVTEKQAELLGAFKGESLYELLANCLGEDEELMAKARLFGYTVMPKRWVVRHEAGKFFEKFTGNGTSRAWVVWKNQAYIFTDRAKAEAVAVLVEGSVEEV